MGKSSAPRNTSRFLDPLQSWRSLADGFTIRNRHWPGPSHPELSADCSDKAPDSLRCFSLNVAHGRHMSTHQALLRRRTSEANVARIGDVISEVNADVVALQEADGPSTWSGNFDHVATLANQSGLEHHVHGHHNPFSVGRLKVTSGTALLSRNPLGQPTSYPFNSNWRDTKGFVVAAVQVPQWNGLEIDLISVHLDFLRPALRHRQILQMAEVLQWRRRPRVMLGDLNCSLSRERSSWKLLEELLDLQAWSPERNQPTFPVHRPSRRIDWILASSELEFADYRTLRTPLSDHLGVVADLRLAGAARDAK
jgi:endonuclease/exonuclease/phosphatase family metal-dependent hydrolase